MNMAMKPSAFKSRLPKPKGAVKAMAKADPKPELAGGPAAPPSKYPKKVAIIFAVCHVIFAVIISIWNFHTYIISPSGLGYFVYILELPSALILVLMGDVQIDPAILYIGAFLINTVFYAVLGYLAGYVMMTYGWDQEVHRLCKLEQEVYEENTGT